MQRYIASRATATPTAPNASIRLCAVGDLMWVPGDWKELFAEEVQTALGSGDLTVANLETPVDPSVPVPRATYARFNAPPALLDHLATAAPMVLSVCNNHALDQGTAGLRRTVAEVNARPGMTPVGGVHAANAAKVVEVSGRKIGVFVTTYGVNPWGPDRGDVLPPGLPIVHFGSEHHRPDWTVVVERVTSLRAAGAELVVAMPHWGFEFEYWPTARQRRDAYRLIELGVDIVIGSSPHVLQPIDLVSVNGADPQCPVQQKRSGGPSMALIAYSLGNFLSSMPTAGCEVGGILGVDIALDGSVEIGALNFQPTVCQRRRVATLRSLPPRRRTRYLPHVRRLLAK
ncbi:MAG: CapA family protein [Myxococcota bacterium]